MNVNIDIKRLQQLPNDSTNKAPRDKAFDATNEAVTTTTKLVKRCEEGCLLPTPIDLKDELKQTKKRLRATVKSASASIEKLKSEVNELKKEQGQTQKRLQSAYEANIALEKDMEKFAETFATQHAEMQQIAGRVRKLVSQNEALKSSNKDLAMRLGNRQFARVDEADAYTCIHFREGKFQPKVKFV
jgi:chromosome segregation ATPase